MISVVIPTFNRETYLAESINSILNQSHKDLELIIVDDGSTDDTKLLVDFYLEKDNRVKYFRLPKNMGIAYARNFGISKSEGEYIAVFDSDDICHPDRLKKELKAIKNVDFVTAGYFLGDENATVTNTFIPEKVITLEHIKRNSNWPHFMIMARKKCFLEHPYRDYRVNDDAFLVWDWFKAGYTYKCIQEPLGIQRGHSGNTSRTRRKEIEATQRVLDKEYEEYENSRTS